VNVQFDRAARRDLSRLTALDAEAATAVVEAIAAFAEDGIGDVRKLQGRSSSEWRLRVGRYRVLFRRESAALTVFAVRDRKDAYRG
jgi:mRNA-degrading endonuclease RelE of RelBE toxin-antitoxin system